ncbi:hypothetical protein YC2023_065310 [Brassica napus]
MSGNTKDKIAVRNNAGKTTPAATAHMHNHPGLGDKRVRNQNCNSTHFDLVYALFIFPNSLI